MKFILVEIKDKDLFTIYDVKNKGVCCCSAYTLKQLLSDHNEVIGCQIVNGKLTVFECDLDGNKRVRKASSFCDDITKRSAVTIERGLDERHYPRVKSERKSKQNDVSFIIKDMSNREHILHINDIKKFIKKDTSEFIGQVVSYDIQNKMLLVISEEFGRLSLRPEFTIIDIKSCRLSDSKKKFFNKFSKYNEQYYNSSIELFNVKNQYQKEQQDLYNRYSAKIRNIEDRLKELTTKSVQIIENNALNNNVILTIDLIKKLTKETLGDKLAYFYEGNIGYISRSKSNTRGLLNVQVSNDSNKLVFCFYISIDCREDRSWIRDNIADEEYDGTLSINTDVYTGEKAAKYWSKMYTNLHKGIKKFSYGCRGDIDKGYYSKDFILEYSFPCKNGITKDDLMKLLSKIE